MVERLAGAAWQSWEADMRRYVGLVKSSMPYRLSLWRALVTVYGSFLTMQEGATAGLTRGR